MDCVEISKTHYKTPFAIINWIRFIGKKFYTTINAFRLQMTLQFEILKKKIFSLVNNCSPPNQESDIQGL